MDFGALPPEINSARTMPELGCAIDMYTEKSACLRASPTTICACWPSASPLCPSVVAIAVINDFARGADGDGLR